MSSRRKGVSSALCCCAAPREDETTESPYLINGNLSRSCEAPVEFVDLRLPANFAEEGVQEQECNTSQIQSQSPSEKGRELEEDLAEDTLSSHCSSGDALSDTNTHPEIPESFQDISSTENSTENILEQVSGIFLPCFSEAPNYKSYGLTNVSSMLAETSSVVVLNLPTNLQTQFYRNVQECAPACTTVNNDTGLFIEIPPSQRRGSMVNSRCNTASGSTNALMVNSGDLRTDSLAEYLEDEFGVSVTDNLPADSIQYRSELQVSSGIDAAEIFREGEANTIQIIPSLILASETVNAASQRTDKPRELMDVPALRSGESQIELQSPCPSELCCIDYVCRNFNQTPSVGTCVSPSLSYICQRTGSPNPSQPSMPQICEETCETSTDMLDVEEECECLNSEDIDEARVEWNCDQKSNVSTVETDDVDEEIPSELSQEVLIDDYSSTHHKKTSDSGDGPAQSTATRRPGVENIAPLTPITWPADQQKLLDTRSLPVMNHSEIFNPDLSRISLGHVSPVSHVADVKKSSDVRHQGKNLKPTANRANIDNTVVVNQVGCVVPLDDEHIPDEDATNFNKSDQHSDTHFGSLETSTTNTGRSLLGNKDRSSVCGSAPTIQEITNIGSPCNIEEPIMGADNTEEINDNPETVGNDSIIEHKGQGLENSSTGYPVNTRTKPSSTCQENTEKRRALYSGLNGDLLNITSQTPVSQTGTPVRRQELHHSPEGISLNLTTDLSSESTENLVRRPGLYNSPAGSNTVCSEVKQDILYQAAEQLRVCNITERSVLSPRLLNQEESHNSMAHVTFKDDGPCPYVAIKDSNLTSNDSTGKGGENEQIRKQSIQSHVSVAHECVTTENLQGTRTHQDEDECKEYSSDSFEKMECDLTEGQEYKDPAKGYNHSHSQAIQVMHEDNGLSPETTLRQKAPFGTAQSDTWLLLMQSKPRLHKLMPEHRGMSPQNLSTDNTIESRIVEDQNVEAKYQRDEQEPQVEQLVAGELGLEEGAFKQPTDETSLNEHTPISVSCATQQENSAAASSSNDVGEHVTTLFKQVNTSSAPEDSCDIGDKVFSSNSSVVSIQDSLQKVFKKLDPVTQLLDEGCALSVENKSSSNYSYASTMYTHNSSVQVLEVEGTTFEEVRTPSLLATISSQVMLDLNSNQERVEKDSDVGDTSCSHPKPAQRKSPITHDKEKQDSQTCEQLSESPSQYQIYSSSGDETRVSQLSIKHDLIDEVSLQSDVRVNDGDTNTATKPVQGKKHKFYRGKNILKCNSAETEHSWPNTSSSNQPFRDEKFTGSEPDTTGNQLFLDPPEKVEGSRSKQSAEQGGNRNELFLEQQEGNGFRGGRGNRYSGKQVYRRGKHDPGQQFGRGERPRQGESEQVSGKCDEFQTGETRGNRRRKYRRQFRGPQNEAIQKTAVQPTNESGKDAKAFCHTNQHDTSARDSTPGTRSRNNDFPRDQREDCNTLSQKKFLGQNCQAEEQAEEISVQPSLPSGEILENVVPVAQTSFSIQIPDEALEKRRRRRKKRHQRKPSEIDGVVPTPRSSSSDKKPSCDLTTEDSDLTEVDGIPCFMAVSSTNNPIQKDWTPRSYSRTAKCDSQMHTTIPKETTACTSFGRRSTSKPKGKSQSKRKEMRARTLGKAASEGDNNPLHADQSDSSWDKRDDGPSPKKTNLVHSERRSKSSQNRVRFSEVVEVFHVNRHKRLSNRTKALGARGDLEGHYFVPLRLGSPSPTRFPNGKTDSEFEELRSLHPKKVCIERLTPRGCPQLETKIDSDCSGEQSDSDGVVGVQSN